MEPSEEAEGSNDEDIYNDLPDFSYGGKIDELQKSNEALRSQLFLLESKLKELKTANTTLTKRERALSRNISVLFATTSAEIEYKNRIIQDLRKERDSLIFRRVRHSTTYETQTTYIPPATDLNCVAKEKEHSESTIVPDQSETITKPVVSDTSVCSPSNNKHPKRGEQSLKDVSNNNVTLPKSSKELPKNSKQKKDGDRMDKNIAENSLNTVKDVSKKTVESTIKPQQASNQKKSGVTQVEESTAVSEATTSVTEDVPQPEASSSTPKLQSQSILRDLLKKGFKMSPFKIDCQTGFKIPKVSGQIPQGGTSNVLKDTEVLSKSYEQQSNSADINVSLKSESSVDISVASVTDCTGGKRCRTFIRSISISENESSSSESKSGSSDSDEKQDLISPQKYSSKVSPKRKVVSSPKMGSRNYVPQNNKYKSSDQRVVDYKSIEKIRIVNGSPKKMVQSPMKCRLKVTAVLEEPARPKHSRGQQPISTRRGEKSSSSDNRRARDASYEQELNHNKRYPQEYKRHSPSPPPREPTIKRHSKSLNRRSPSSSRSRSPSPRRQKTSHRKHSPSSSRSSSPPLSRRRNRSPRRRSPYPHSPSSRGHSPSPPRSHSPSPIRKRSLTPVRYSPSATRRHSLTPRKRSPSAPRSLPCRKQSPSSKRHSTSPTRRHSTSPIRRNSSSPPRKRSLSPFRGHSPSSSRDSPSPILRLSPSPMKHPSPSPPQRHSPPSRSKRVPSPKRRSPSPPPRRRSPSPPPPPPPPRRHSPSPPPRRRSPSPPPRRRSPSPLRNYSPSPRRQHKDKGRCREDVYLPHSPPRKSHRDLRNYIRMKKVEHKKASKRNRPPSPEYFHHKRRRLQEPERRGPHPKKIAHYERHFKVEERAERKSSPRRHEEVQKRSQNGHHHSEDKHKSRSPVIYQNSHHRNEHDYKSDENAHLNHTKEKGNHKNIKGPVKSRIRIIRASISPDGEEADSPVNRIDKSVHRHRSPDNEIPKIPAGNKISRKKIQILDRESSDCSSDAEEANQSSTQQTVIPYKPQTTRSPSHSLEEGEITDSS